MFTANEAGWDRVLRVVIGSALVYFGWTGATWVGTVMAIIGLVLVLTGLVGWCALYRLLGVSTLHRPGREARHI